MTRLLFINPNTTESMTAKIGAAATQAASEGVTVETITSPFGPKSIQGAEDGEAAVPGLLQALKAGIEQGYDGYAIACFDDTGLAQCRQLTDTPVIGIGQAAFHCSMLLSETFSVVTTLAVSVPVIEQNLKQYGLASSCKRVRASDVPVLALEQPGSDAEKRISDEIADAIANDGCKSIVLGCAGMAPLAARLTMQHGVPVIDGVVCATGLLSNLHKLRLSQRLP